MQTNQGKLFNGVRLGCSPQNTVTPRAETPRSNLILEMSWEREEGGRGEGGEREGQHRAGRIDINGGQFE